MAITPKVKLCSFCGRMHKEVRLMIKGPAEVYICELCVAFCKNQIDQKLGLVIPSATKRGKEPACSFCKKSAKVAKKMITAPGGACICQSCVAVCVKIIDRELRARGLPAQPAKAPRCLVCGNASSPQKMTRYPSGALICDCCIHRTQVILRHPHLFPSKFKQK